MTDPHAAPRGVSFVAGATGYTGRAVVRALREQRQGGVVAHVRPDSPQRERWRERFTAWGAQVDETPWTLEAMTRTLARHRPAAVFALLGTTRARARAAAREGADASYEAIDRGLTALLIEAAEACAPPPRLVYLSAVGVSEGSSSAYMQARWQVEQRLRAGSAPWTIARPSFITGPDREASRPGERVAAALTDGALALAGLLGARTLRARYRSMNATTLAAALVEAAFDPAAEGQVLEGDALLVSQRAAQRRQSV